MKAIGLIIVVGCLLVSGSVSRCSEPQPRGVQLLLAYNVYRKQPNLKPFFEPYVPDDSSWCLVIDGQGRAIAWSDPNRPFDRITHTIGKERLNALYQQVFEAGMSLGYLPYPGAIEQLGQIRPDRVTVLPGDNEVAGATDAGRFTISGGPLRDYEPARDHPMSAALRRSVKILQPVYDEAIKRGKPERLNYVRYVYWNDLPRSNRNVPNQGFVVGDGQFKAWSGGIAWSDNRMISADTEKNLLAHLTNAGLFGLKPVTRADLSTIASPAGTKGNSVAIVQARIDDKETTVVVTPAIAETLTGFRSEMENVPEK